MTDIQEPFWSALRQLNNGVIPTPLFDDIRAVLNKHNVPRSPPSNAQTPGGVMAAATASDGLTARVVMELVGHEAIVQEAYKDSVGVWTWAVGVTSASGHDVDRYKDNPQPIRKCLEISIWLMRNKYLPDVLAAFRGRTLTENQLAAALSFHYNTGAIKRASWVRSFMEGKPTQAKAQIMEWRSPPEIVERRQKERDLFFDGKWSNTGLATVYPVRKPSYSPHWSQAKKVEIRADVEALLK